MEWRSFVYAKVKLKKENLCVQIWQKYAQKSNKRTKIKINKKFEQKMAEK